ncbi:MAG: DUF4340 domain-containing protein [Bacteroidetes bacterium]|nr:MAG: DUF4340 domain-containing protein [Bacteroidota bacterium]
MQQKQLVWLFGALVALLVLAFVTGVFDAEISTVDVPEVTIPTEAVTHIRIERADAPLELRREASGWHLTAPMAFPADSATVARLLDGLAELELESVVSTNPERYGRYGVDSTAQVLTLAWDGGEQRVVPGRQGPDFQSVYVRIGEDPRVFLARANLTVPEDLTRWRDKTVVEVPPAAVTEVQVRKGETAYTVRRGEGWQIDEAGTTAPADSAAVERWLGRFAPMRAAGFFDDVPADSVRRAAAHRITLVTGGGTRTLALAERDEALALAVDGRDVTYRLGATQLNTFLPDPATLKAE